MNEKNPNKAYSVFSEELKRCYNTAFPIVTKRQRKKIRKPWIDDSLYERIKDKNKMYHAFVNAQNRDLNLFEEFKKVRNKLNSDIRDAKTNYYTNKFYSMQDDTRKTWEAVN